ncbi:hypothetical protein H2199_000583 [Coniosporium tulheliwenetii]|uniref:Uncharacterized protein n=1 Tax=Coniosporium tulheliwenetii TaxID=3383036 RepID=A0ACC2ZQR5_9PEZI|nr:hypothetical protein H2199_000583 [Cladosporium sp. JES 115]
MQHDALEGRETRDLADPTTVDHPDPIEENVNGDPAGGDQWHAIREERLQSVTARDLNKPDDDPLELQDLTNASLGNHNNSPPAELQPLPAAIHDRSSLELDFGFSDIDGNDDDNIGEDDRQAESTVLRNKSSPPRPGFYRDSGPSTDNSENGTRGPHVDNLGNGHAGDDDVGINEDRGGNRPDTHCPISVVAAQPGCSDHLSPKHQGRAADLAQSNNKDEHEAELSQVRSGGCRSFSYASQAPSQGRPRMRGLPASHPSAPLLSSLPALAAPAQIEIDRVDEAAAEAQPTITDVNFHELSKDMEDVAFLTACVRGVRLLPKLSPARLSTLLRGILGDAQLPFGLTTRQLTEDLAFLECFVVQCRGVEAPPENGTMVRPNGVGRKIGNVRAVELHDDEHYAGDDGGNSEGDAEPSQSAKRRSWSEEEEKCLLAWR